MSREYQTFNTAMNAILRADPAAVRKQIDAEMKANTEQREAKGERKRGRKKAANRRPLASSRASDSRS